MVIPRLILYCPLEIEHLTHSRFSHVLGAFLFTLLFPHFGVPRRLLLAVLFVAVLVHGYRVSYQYWSSLLKSEPIFIWWFIWAAVSLMSLMWSTNVAYSFKEIQVEIGYGLFVFAAFYFTARHMLVWQILGRWLLCAMIIAALSILCHSLRLPIPRVLNLAGPGVVSTMMSITLLVGTFIAFSDRKESTENGKKLGVVVIVLSMVIAGLTGNRAFWVCAIPSFLILIWGLSGSPWSTKHRLTALVLVSGFGFLALMLVTHGRWLETYGAGLNDGTRLISLDERNLLWPATLEVIQARPWLGHGFGNAIARESILKFTTRDFYHGHNLLLNAALQLGMAGILIIAGLVILILKRCSVLLTVRGNFVARPSKDLGWFLLSLLVVLLVKNFTDDFLFREAGLFFWAILGANLGTLKLQRIMQPTAHST